MPAELPGRVGLSDVDYRPSGTAATLPARATLTGSPRRDRLFRLPFPGGEFVLRLAAAPPQWVRPTVQAASELLSLPANWDSYGAPRIDPNCVEAALRLVLDVMRDDTPAPSVVPTSRGGVQLEWHTRGIDLEVEFLTPFQLRGFFEDGQSGTSWEEDLSFDWGRLTAAIATLSRRV